MGGLWAEEDKGRAVAFAERIFGKNAGNQLFYYPTKTSPRTPAAYGYQFDDVTFQSGDGTKLNGWFISTLPGVKPKGTIVFHHGNTGAMGYHLGFCLWMVKAGYQVLMYDYRGYGGSEGVVSRKGMVGDARAALKYVKSRKDVDGTRLVSYGHSLGAAKSVAALGEEMVEGVRAVVSFAGFSSYKRIAKKMAGKFGHGFVSDDYEPKDYVAKIAPVPLLIVHGESDATVPVGHAEELFGAAKKPKTLLRIPKGGHSGALYQNQNEGRKKVLGWLEKVMK